MAVLDKLEEKWYRKALAGFKEKWAAIVRQATTYEAWVAGIAAVTGLPETTVRASFPAREYAEFQKNPEAYLPKALAKIEAAYRTKKWSRKYKEAFTRS